MKELKFLVKPIPDISLLIIIIKMEPYSNIKIENILQII
jgi:hypothetical protein